VAGGSEGGRGGRGGGGAAAVDGQPQPEGGEPPREKFYRPSTEKIHSPYQQQQPNDMRKRKNQ